MNYTKVSYDEDIDVENQITINNKNKDTLLTITYDSLLNCDYNNILLYAFALITKFVMNVLLSITFNEIANGNNINFWLTTFVIINCITPFHWLLIETPSTIEITKDLISKYAMTQYEYYDKLEFQQKMNYDIYEFHIKLNKIFNALENLIGFGVKIIINLISSLIGCFYVFYVRKQIVLLFVLVLSNILTDQIILKYLRNNLDEDRKLRDIENDKHHNKQMLFLPLFQYGDKNIEDMTDYIKGKLKLNFKNKTQYWNYFYFTNMLINKLPYIFVLLISNDIITIMILINLIDNLNNTLNSVNNFMTGLNEHKSNFEIYHDKKKEINNLNNENNRLDVIIKCMSKKQNIMTSNMAIYHNKEIKTNIMDNDILIIRGETGVGKTTFLNFILGKIKNKNTYIKITNNSYYVKDDYCFEFYQSIKEKMPTSNVTLYDLFEVKDNETNLLDDINLAIECLNLCVLDSWFKNIKLNSNENKKAVDCHEKIFGKICCLLNQNNVIELTANNNDNSFELLKINRFNTNINNKISGGEKSRLAIAIKIFKMLKKIYNSNNQSIKNNNWLLILDEPEQGCDSAVAELMLSKIIELCNFENNECKLDITFKNICNIRNKLTSGIPLIMVTHLCDCIVNKLKYTKKIEMTKKSQ